MLLSFDAITTYQFENDTMEFKIELKQKTYSTIEYEYTIQWRWYSVKLYQKGEADIDCSFYNEYLNNTQAGQLPFKSIQYIDSKNLDLVRIKIGTDSDKVKFSVGTSNFDQEPILKKKMGKN